jgi:hypothetical protein
MDDTTIAAENVEVIQTQARSGAAFSWSAAIAGTLAAIAITFIVVSLGTGIELSVASPYTASPTASTMTIAGAIWLVLAQSIGFAAGGFIAGRLRVNSGATSSVETRFRDGANGFVAWAIGAVALAALLAAGSIITATAAMRTGESVVAQATENASVDQLGYFVDSLMRTTQSRTGADADRAQVTRILANAVRNGQLSDDDRTYLATLVAGRTGVSQEEAQKRVDDVVNRARASITQATDAARKAGAYVAFWTFMSMLFGAVAATLGGILGGEHRDESMLEPGHAFRGP